MNIAVNTRLLIKDKLEGIGWFSYEVLKRIVREHPEHTFYFLFDRPYSSEFIFADNVKPVVLYPPARHPVLFRIWFNWSVTRFLKKNKIDLFFSPDGYLSLRTNVPQIAVIHDLNFEHYPEFLPPHITAYYKKYFPLFAQKAAKIITVSNFSKNDIIELYGVDKNKIQVAYNGINDNFTPLSPEEKDKVKSEYTQGQPYFIYVGSLNKRKNINNMLKAFDFFKQTYKTNHKFILVGEILFNDTEFRKTYLDLVHKESIIFTGRLYDQALKNLLGAAEALLYVSYFEGFGIPLVEAMKSEVPAITSNKSSLPEIGGKAALYCNPDDVEGISLAMKKVLSPSVRRNLIEEAKQRSKKFNWDKTALEVWKAMKSVKPEL